MNEYLQLAKKAIQAYLKNGEIFDPGQNFKNIQTQKAGCFVSVHLKDNNELRGCIGTILPTCKNLTYEIINNAISACRDPRFLPISKDEIANLDISVDILSAPEPIDSEKLLDPKKYGAIVKSADGRTGLLLPDLEGVDDVGYQLEIARQKAGILPNEKISLFRFQVQRYKEN